MAAQWVLPCNWTRSDASFFFYFSLHAIFVPVTILWLFCCNIYLYFYSSIYYSSCLCLTIQILNSNSREIIHHIYVLFALFIHSSFIDFPSNSVCNFPSHHFCRSFSLPRCHFCSIRSFCQVSPVASLLSRLSCRISPVACLRWHLFIGPCTYILPSCFSIDSVSYYNMASAGYNSVLTSNSLVRCEYQYGVMICLKCESAFPMTHISNHLGIYHHYPIGLYRSIFESLKRCMLAEDWKDLQYPIDQKARIKGVNVYHGCAYTGCGARTTSNDIARDHAKCGEEIMCTHLQCWNQTAAYKYWMVTVPGDSGKITMPQLPVLVPGIFSSCFFWYRNPIGTCFDGKIIVTRSTAWGARDVSMYRAQPQWWYEPVASVYAMGPNISWKGSYCNSI